MGTDFGGELEGAPEEGGFEGDGELTQWSGLDEDAADLVSKKGFKGQNDLARAYAELEREHGRLRSERDNLVEAYQTAEDWEPTPDPTPMAGAGGNHMDFIGQLAGMVDNGQVEAGRALMANTQYLMENVLPEMVEKAIAGRVGPMEHKLTERELRDSAMQIRQQLQEAGLGDVAPDLAAKAAALAKPGSMFDSPQGMRAAMAIAYMERDLAEKRTQRVRDRSQTADNGGRVAAQRANMAEEFKKLLMGDG